MSDWEKYLVKPSTYRQRLTQQSKEMKDRAADIDKVIEMFDKNPDFESLLDAMRRSGVWLEEPKETLYGIPYYTDPSITGNWLGFIRI